MRDAALCPSACVEESGICFRAQEMASVSCVLECEVGVCVCVCEMAVSEASWSNLT